MAKPSLAALATTARWPGDLVTVVALDLSSQFLSFPVSNSPLWAVYHRAPAIETTSTAATISSSRVSLHSTRRHAVMVAGWTSLTASGSRRSTAQPLKRPSQMPGVLI
ncbi:hypothetical protein NL676_002655 [Syzygium grande]|nr:hypothetical protein NL676_002655 [Syzygium grande]